MIASQPHRAILDLIRRTCETAVIKFIDENGGDAGVCLCERPAQITSSLRNRFFLLISNFIDENGGGPGVRLRKGSQKKR